MNSRKLDEVLQILKGQPNQPGLMEDVHQHEVLLMGKEGELGLIQKVNILWRAHLWVACTLSGLAGFMLRGILK